MGSHGSMSGRVTHGTDRSQHMLCYPVLHKSVVVGVITWRGASLLVVMVLAATAATRRNAKPVPTRHTPVIPRKLPCFWLHGNAFPFSSMEIPLFTTTSGILNETCWKGKLSQAEKERVFSTACQALTSMERGLHTKTVPLSSYCSAGSCFWSVCMRCQRRVFS